MIRIWVFFYIRKGAGIGADGVLPFAFVRAGARPTRIDRETALRGKRRKHRVSTAVGPAPRATPVLRLSIRTESGIPPERAKSAKCPVC